MNYRRILWETAKIMLYGSVGVLISENSKWLSPLFHRADIELLKLLEPQEWYQATKSLLLTSVVLTVAFSILLYLFHRFRSKEYVEMKERKRKRLEQLDLVRLRMKHNIEFDVYGTLTNHQTGERFCPECERLDKTLSVLRPMEERRKGFHVCSRCGAKYG